jgi:hypothetical protein
MMDASLMRFISHVREKGGELLVGKRCTERHIFHIIWSFFIGGLDRYFRRIIEMD